MAATILLPAGLIALGAEGLLLAEAGGIEAVSRNAQRLEILLDGVGTAAAKTQIVFRGATFVAVAFDGYFDWGLALEKVRGFRRRDARDRGNGSLVGGEIGGEDVRAESA